MIANFHRNREHFENLAATTGFGPPIEDPMIELDGLDEVDRTSSGITFYQRRIEGDWRQEFQHSP